MAKKKNLRKILNKPSKNVTEIGNRASVDAKLTYATLLLNYAFEYGVDFKNRIITLTGDINEGIWFDIVDAALNQMEADSKSKVTIKINSGGGETYEAMAVVGRIQASKCYIVTEGYGHIMSAATLILACGDKRRISKYTQFMWHESWYGTHGKHSETKAYVKQVEIEEQMWADAMADMSNKDPKYWAKTGVGIDRYYKASDLLDLGVVDEIF